jgi:hypothetical protein
MEQRDVSYRLPGTPFYANMDSQTVRALQELGANSERVALAIGRSFLKSRPFNQLIDQLTRALTPKRSKRVYVLRPFNKYGRRTRVRMMRKNGARGKSVRGLYGTTSPLLTTRALTSTFTTRS